jgi:hypothetical protein
MTTTTHDIGDAENIKATFKNANGTPTDPSDVTFDMIEPDGTKTTYAYATDAQLVRESAGIYHVIWTWARQGRHHVIWKGTGSLIEAGASEFYVKRQAA